MTEKVALEDRTSTRVCACCSSACCTNCCDEFGRKVLQKKPISIDLGQLLRTQLNRCLRTVDLIGYGIASMLGGTIFVLSGTVARNKSGPGTFVAYVLAGVVALLNALNYAELACRFPKAGSTYTYAYVLLGEMPAFLAGWSIFLEYILGMSTVARGWSSSLDSLTRGAIANWTAVHIGRFDHANNFFAEQLDFVAAALVIIVVITTCFGIEKSSWLNLVFTSVNVLALTLVSVFMLVYAQPNLLLLPLPENTTSTSSLPLDTLTPFLPYGVSGLIAATATCFNAYIGFDMMSMCAEEVADPGKSIPRANVISVSIVTLLLCMAAISLTMYIPWFSLDVGAPFLEAMQVGPGNAIARTVLFYVVGVGCLIGISSNLLTNAIAAPRMLYAMGQDGLVFVWLARVTEPFKTPMVASVPVAVIASVLALIFSICSLADFLSLGTLIAYSMSAIGVLILRYCPAPEKVVGANFPKPLSSSENDREKEELAKKYGDVHNDSKGNPAQSDPVCISASRIDKPGYLKKSWAAWLPQSLVERMTVNRGPGEVCKVNMGIFVVFVLLLHVTVLIIPQTAPYGWSYWRMAGAVLWLLALALCVLVFSMHQQFSAPRPNTFRLPLVPFLPCATIVFNALLISQLSWMTWVRFLIWVLMGALIYVAYGVWHSNPADNTESDVLLGEKD
uniref:AA_permease_C domain-containing protein n=1 Tax=Mesocestoides corti TaxID=53468 RepID=A0A5K3F1J2_MESCO